MTRGRSRVIGTAVAVLVGVTIAAELVLRWTGFGDFPLYRSSAGLDYVPQPIRRSGSARGWRG